jgi:hypothetical protein
MRKIVLSGVAALGILAIGLAPSEYPAAAWQAAGASSHKLAAPVETHISNRVQDLLAAELSPGGF